MPAGPIQRLLEADHARLDALLTEALGDPRADAPGYRAFREGLLRHIAMEEKVLLPEARRRQEGAALPVATQLRADHRALAALLVPPPDRPLLETLRAVLAEHNPLEEGPGALYAVCETLVGAEAEAVLARLEAVPPVRVAPHRDGERVRAHLARLLEARAAP